MNMVRNLLCLCALLVLCALAPAQKAVSLLGNTWKLTELNGKPPVKGSVGVPWLLLDAKSTTLTGYGGVNRFQGKYTMAKRQFKLDPGMSTLIGASKPLMDQENAFHKAIQMAESYIIKKNELWLIYRNQVLARFKA